MGYDVETNIIHISIFFPASSPGAYVAEHTYVKCSDATAKKIITAISDSESLAMSLHSARFVCYRQSSALQQFGEYTAVKCGQGPPSLDSFLLNGVAGGPRLTHVVCFVVDSDGHPLESAIYSSGEVRTIGVSTL